MKINKSNNRPIVFVANSSWYLFHYRNGLIKKCAEKEKVISLSPIDKSTEYLSSISLHIPWKMSRKNASDPFSILISSFRMFFLLRAIKPKLVQSHTLKANLIVSICCSLLGLPCVLSFAGLGNLLNTKKTLLLNFILKFIYLTGKIERVGFLRFSFSKERVNYIFQNNRDKRIFEKVCNPNPNQVKLILGSGVPMKFIKFIENNKLEMNFEKGEKIEGGIFCGRLLKSKGINIFIDIAKKDPSRKYFVYGGIDESSSDSLTKKDIEEFKLIENLEFNGVVEDPLLKFYNKKFILIAPSIYGEGLPRSIAEALILGIPVICSSEALSEIFSSKMLTTVRDRESMSYLQKINELEKKINFKLFSNKIKLGREFVLNNLSETNVIEETMKIYRYFEKRSKNIYTNREYLINSRRWISN